MIDQDRRPITSSVGENPPPPCGEGSGVGVNRLRNPSPTALVRDGDLTSHQASVARQCGKRRLIAAGYVILPCSPATTPAS